MITMKFMNKNIVLIPSILFGLIICWFIFIYLPARKEMGNLHEKLAQLVQKQKEIVPEHKIHQMRLVVDSLKTEVDSCLSRFYPDEELVTLGRMVDALSKRHKLTLISVVPDYESLSVFSDQTDDIFELPLTFTFDGEFRSLTQFLDDMPGFPYVMRLNEVLIEKEDVTSEGIQIIVKGVIVFRNEEMSKDEDVSISESKLAHVAGWNLKNRAHYSSITIPRR